MKGLSLMRVLLTLLVGFVALTTATAQTSTDPNEGSRLTYDSLLGSYEFSWWGQPGRTYFIQQSDDLSAWEYLPLIESGAGDVLAWGFTSTASKLFLRLRYSDIPTSDPFNDDFDGDKISNYDEVVFGTDPLSAVDTDANGLPDDWERFYFGHTGVDPNATAPGGGMTNLQHFQLGSNPNNAPPPPTITADTATLDQNAESLLYPTDDSQFLLQNGNFSVTSLGSNDWNTFSGITGWTAISGSLIELQQIEVNTGAGAGQYCELDSHWPTEDHSGPSDHGIQQTVNLARGRYLLLFDYRGRQHEVEAGSFSVKVKSTGSSTDVTLVTKNSASSTEWKRASATFDVSGGNPNTTQLPITVQFDSTDARDSYGAYIDNVILLPAFNSVDRLLTGSIPILFDGMGLEFATKSGQVLGRYENLSSAMSSSSGDGSNYHIYGSRDEIFDTTEGQQITNGNVDAKRFSTRIVFYKEGAGRLRFMTVFDDLGDIEIRILKNSETAAAISHTLEADEKTYRAIVQSARTLAQVSHLPDFDNLAVADDPFDDTSDDDSQGLTAPSNNSQLSPPVAAGAVTLPGRPFDEVPTNIRDRVANIVPKLFGPIFTEALLAGPEWRETWNLKMLYMDGLQRGFCMGLEAEVNNAVSTVQFANEVARLTTDPLAALYRGRELFRTLLKLQQDISAAGGPKEYVRLLVNNVKENAESAFDWLNTGYISDENDAFILGYGAGYATETVALFVALNLLTDGEAAMGKAVALIRQGTQAIQFLNYAGKFKIRMLMWSLNYGRYFQVTMRVGNDTALVVHEVEEVAKMLEGLAKAASPYNTPGGSLGVLAQRYQRIDELARVFAKGNRQANGFGNWLRTKHAAGELATLSEAMGASTTDALSVSGMRGAARMAQSMCVVAKQGNTDVAHIVGFQSVRNYLAKEHDWTKLPIAGSIAFGEADPLFALFDEGTPFVLLTDGQTWVYNNALSYGPMVGTTTGELFGEQHRIAHVLHHTFLDTSRTPYSVFAGLPHQVFAKLDQAWAARSGPGVLKKLATGNAPNDVYRIPWPGAGTNAGEDYIWLVLKKNTTEVITAYPVAASTVP